MFRIILICAVLTLVPGVESVASPLIGSCSVPENKKVSMSETVIKIIETEHYYKLELRGKAAIYTWTKTSPETKKAQLLFKESLDYKIPLYFAVDPFTRDICSVDKRAIK